MIFSHLKPFNRWLPHALKRKSKLLSKVLKSFCGLAPINLPDIFIFTVGCILSWGFLWFYFPIDQSSHGLLSFLNKSLSICVPSFLCIVHLLLLYVYLMIIFILMFSSFYGIEIESGLINQKPTFFVSFFFW